MADMIPHQDPFSRTDERALINLVPHQFGKAMVEAYKKNPEWFGCAEHDLYKTLGKQGVRPNPSDNRLRMKFWMEYDQAQTEFRRMNMRTVFSGVCSESYFFNYYLTDTSKMAWILTPPANYLVVTEEALQVGLETLRAYLEEPAIKEDGKIDAKVAELQLKIVAMLDQRVKGAIVQRTMNLHASVPKNKIEEVLTSKSMEELEKRLRAIEQRRKKVQGATLDKTAFELEQKKSDGGTEGAGSGG